MNIIVKTTGGYASSLNGKIKSSNNTLANITRDILMKSSHKKFGAIPIIMPYGSPDELRIGCVVMLLTSAGMDKDLHTNTLKYGV